MLFGISFNRSPRWQHTLFKVQHNEKIHMKKKIELVNICVRCVLLHEGKKYGEKMEFYHINIFYTWDIRRLNNIDGYNVFNAFTLKTMLDDFASKNKGEKYRILTMMIQIYCQHLDGNKYIMPYCLFRLSQFFSHDSFIFQMLLHFFLVLSLKK